METNVIYNEDCLKGLRKLPDKSVDLILCDPPYGLNYNQNDLASQREKIFGGKIQNMKPNGIQTDGEEEAMELFRAMLTEAKRVLKRGACCCCCCGGGGGPKPLFAKWTLIMDEIIGFKQAVVWDKPGLGMGIHFRRNYEFVLIAQNGSPAHRWNGGRTTPNIVRISKIIPRKDQHPTEKPVALMAWFVNLFSNTGDIIVDPFAGQGSTGVAAISNNRKFIGYEIDKKHFTIAQKKINKAKNQILLF